MKIFLRVLGILALVFIIFSIFIATQPSSYNVKRTRIIKAPVSLAFSTINEYKTWKSWGPWVEMDSTIVQKYDVKTSGVGAGYSWTSKVDRPGSIKTIALEENKSIQQVLSFEGQGNSDNYWEFSPKENGSEVTWGMKGELGFLAKVFFFLSGGQEKMFGAMLEKGLKNLDTFTQKEMDKHSFTSNGIVDYGGGYFVYLTTECSFDEAGAALDSMLPDLLVYCMKNKYPRAGSFFTLYHKHDEKTKRAEFSSCYPVAERVITDGKFGLAFLEPGRYHKTTFQGDYKYADEAWKKAFEFAKNEGYTIPEDGKPFESYVLGHTKSLNPADWITEIYLPVE